MTAASAAPNLDLAMVKKWAKAQEKLFKQLKKDLDKADDVTVVIKAMDVEDPSMRNFRNRARKLQREAPSAGRLRKSVLREVDAELKRFAKLLALI